MADFTSTRRGLLGAIGLAPLVGGAFAATPALGALPPAVVEDGAARSEVLPAMIALRAHNAAYNAGPPTDWTAEGKQREAAFNAEHDRLEATFIQSRARHLRDLSRKMCFILFEDHLSTDGAHNAMVHVMAQMERWA